MQAFLSNKRLKMEMKKLTVLDLANLVNKRVLVKTKDDHYFCAQLEQIEDGFKWVMAKIMMEKTAGAPEPLWLFVKDVEYWCELPKTYKEIITDTSGLPGILT